MISSLIYSPELLHWWLLPGDWTHTILFWTLHFQPGSLYYHNSCALISIKITLCTITPLFSISYQCNLHNGAASAEGSTHHWCSWIQQIETQRWHNFKGEKKKKKKQFLMSSLSMNCGFDVPQHASLCQQCQLTSIVSFPAWFNDVFLSGPKEVGSSKVVAYLCVPGWKSYNYTATWLISDLRRWTVKIQRAILQGPTRRLTSFR